MQLHIEVQNCYPQGGSKALPWSLRTMTFALVWNPDSHHVIHWLSALVFSASGHSSYQHSLFLGKSDRKESNWTLQLSAPTFPSIWTLQLSAQGPPAAGHSSYQHKLPQQLDTLAICTRLCGSDATESSNWTLQLSAQEFPSNWTFQLSAQESPSN